MHFSSIEITSVVFLIIFTILIVPAIYLWVSYIRAGYPWRYGFWGAFLLCAARLACFISELVFYGSNYKNTSAAIAFIVTLSIGFIGLLECESALFISWAESHIDFNPTQQQIHGKIRLLNIVGLVLIIYGSTNYDGHGNVSGAASACIKAGTIIFLVLTVIQSLYIAYGFMKYGKSSRTLAILAVIIAALYVRIIFGVYSTFHRNVSIITFNTANVKYLVGATLIPEVVALILMIVVGWLNVRSDSFKARKHQGQHQEAYNIESLQAQKHGQTAGTRH
ncbi:hypothetical protein H072_8337 [Dactylellina haptotyla CBS 200.50]|uniref:DUF7702 domain-containing protein n=1 Tax=Dactylellina haptotyla (strain CBS 200.50) TaxID=1284197 RepID=S8A479_DACHA|nr:hypothetical protein H072_8337 [Dactylellina haptotyla CBS 200.50]